MLTATGVTVRFGKRTLYHTKAHMARENKKYNLLFFIINCIFLFICQIIFL